MIVAPRVCSKVPECNQSLKAGAESKGRLGSSPGKPTSWRLHSEGASVEGDGLRWTLPHPTQPNPNLRAGRLTWARTITVTSVKLPSFKLNKCFTALWGCRNHCCQRDCTYNSYSGVFTLIPGTMLVVLWLWGCWVMMLMGSLLSICWNLSWKKWY